MITLGLDTSGKTASAAVMKDGELLGEFTYQTRLTHSQIIMPLVCELLERLDIDIKDIDCFAVADGPGSYTGLRIGVAAVKGLTFGRDAKCFGVSTLRSLANNVKTFDGVIFSVMTARPKVAYFGAYKIANGELAELFPDRVCTFEEISKLAQKVDEKIMLVGDGAKKIKTELFAEDERIKVAPASLLTQKASSLCEIAEKNEVLWLSADSLEARYLQAVKADKLSERKK